MKVPLHDKDKNTDYVNIEPNELTICRVCGFDNIDYFPWGKDGTCPEYTYCLCCGVEAGNQDYSIQSIREFRDSWLTNGAKWDDPEKKPVGWDIENSLSRIPGVFR